MRIEHRLPKILAIVMFAAVCLGIFAWLYSKAGGTLPGADPGYQATVLVPTAFQLVPNADVRRAGVKVGKVKSITNDGDVGVVRIQIDADQGPVYRDATVRVRTKTLVGENYVDLDPGTLRAGRLDAKAALPLEQAGEAVQLDQILSGLDAPTRAAIQQNLDVLGPGTRGRGVAINRLLGASSPTVRKLGGLTDLLDGQREQLARVVDQTGTVMQAFADRTGDLRRLAVEARRTADAAASRDKQLSAVVGELPGTLEQVRRTTTHVGGVARRSTPVVADLRVAVEQFPLVTERLASAARVGQRLLAVLPSFSRRAEPMLRSLRAFGDDAAPAVPALDGVLRRLNPALSYLAPRATDMATALGNLGSAADTRDATGQLARVHLLLDEQTINGLAPSVHDTLSVLMKAGGLSQIHATKRNAYPDPGTRGNPSSPGTMPPRLTATPAGHR